MKKLNFSIIAHIDHGKSTLADRLIETCNAVEKRKMQAQMLDNLAVERERGITVKSQTVRLEHSGVVLNLIDTPGHVDFSFEVRRALAASDAAIILVDATQGIEAQTIANVYRAMEEDVELIPVINKVDLPSAQIDSTKLQIREILGITDEPVLISAKTGQGIGELMKTLVAKVASFETAKDDEFRALLIDAWFDNYLGVVLLVKVETGVLHNKEQFKFFSKETKYKIEKLGFLKPDLKEIEQLEAGDVGVIIANIRNVHECIIGDTLTKLDYKGEKLREFRKQKAAVFCGLFPIDSSLYHDMKDALEKLAINDSSLTIEPAHSPALGVGFRCGFLGLLHLEVTQQRLEQEFDIEVIITAPSVEYKIIQTNAEELFIHNSADMPDSTKIETIYEPWVKLTIFSPETYMGEIIKLCLEKRAQNQQIEYLSKIGQTQNVTFTYDIPLSEIIFDFHDKLKSISKGYASFDYDETDLKATEVDVVDLLINGEKIPSLSTIVHKIHAVRYGRWACEKLKEALPRQQFSIAIQAAINSKIIARETLSAFRKDVTAKCYGGDVTRKNKLLDNQKKGKKRLKEFFVGKISVPNSAMLKILKRSEN